MHAYCNGTVDSRQAPDRCVAQFNRFEPHFDEILARSKLIISAEQASSDRITHGMTVSDTLVTLVSGLADYVRRQACDARLLRRYSRQPTSVGSL
jgi:hypothetical protein